jgi:hypothetical protein
MAEAQIIIYIINAVWKFNLVRDDDKVMVKENPRKSYILYWSEYIHFEDPQMGNSYYKEE